MGLADISQSHLNKIEAGIRKPSFDTLENLMEILKIDMVVRNEHKTVKERSVKRIEVIIWRSSDKDAVVLADLVEYIARRLDFI